MQEECDFQSSLMEKKVSAEARLDTAASSITLSETEIKKSVRIPNFDEIYSLLILYHYRWKLADEKKLTSFSRYTREVSFDRHYGVHVFINDTISILRIEDLSRND